MKYVSWALLALVASTAAACARTPAGAIRIEGDHFVYPSQQAEASIRLGPSLDAWNVSCDKRHALVWGRAWDQIQPGDAPYSNLYLLDLDKGEIVAHVTVSSGPYETEFSQDQALVRIDERILRQADGTEVDPPPAFHPETYAPFAGKNSA